MHATSPWGRCSICGTWCVLVLPHHMDHMDCCCPAPPVHRQRVLSARRLLLSPSAASRHTTTHTPPPPWTALSTRFLGRLYCTARTEDVCLRSPHLRPVLRGPASPRQGASVGRQEVRSRGGVRCRARGGRSSLVPSIDPAACLSPPALFVLLVPAGGRSSGCWNNKGRS